MAPVCSSVRQLVNDNSKNDFTEAAGILLKFANNIINNPTEEKYKKIRLSNPTVENKLLPVSGALECLFEMGFEEVGPNANFCYESDHFRISLRFSIKNYSMFRANRFIIPVYTSRRHGVEAENCIVIGVPSD